MTHTTPPKLAPGRLRRRAFLGAIPALGLLGLGGEPAAARGAQDASDPDDLAAFPRQPASLAAQVVGKSHSDASAVAALLEARPDLAKAAIDWGFGDWETALGAASHVGRRDIAELLIRHGARPDLFTMAMLGWTDGVRGALEARPELARVRGPHGFTLAHHARAGGERASTTAEYLSTVAGTDEGVEAAELDALVLERCVGEYRVGGEPGGVVVVEVGRRGPAIRRSDGVSHRLLHEGGGVFRPTGTEGVRITFTGVDEGPARSISVHAPAPVLVAPRA